MTTEIDAEPDQPVHQHHGGHPRLAEVLPALRRGVLRFVGAGVLPVAVFYLTYRAFGPAPGILAGMSVSLAVLGVQAYRLRRLDPIALVPMALILVQGILGMLTGSIELYLAAPAIEALIWGVLLIGSAILKRPLVPLIARELGVVPTRFMESAGLRRSLELLTVGWGIASFVKAGLRLYLLSWMELEAFLVTVTVGVALVNVVMLGLSVWLPLMMVKREPRATAA
jgi:intracellular septation protein A